VAQRQMRGNLPQAFVHALLLETARALADSPAGSPKPTEHTKHYRSKE
jgi:alpha,alpha-trehalase